MTKQEFQLEKAKAIAELVTNSALEVVKITKRAYPRKRAFIYKDKKLIRKKRFEKRHAQLNLYFTANMRAIQLAQIIAQPYRND